VNYDYYGWEDVSNQLALYSDLLPITATFSQRITGLSQHHPMPAIEVPCASIEKNVWGYG
jgi:hypothetical protein